MTAPLVLAVDGGNFKTDLALARADGETLALVRGPQSSPHHLGIDGCVRVLEEQRTGIPRAAEVAQIERELLELYRDPALTTKPALLERRGGAFYSEAATQLVAALATGSGDAQVVDVRNYGTVAGLAEDDAVELPARIEASGPVPLSQPPLAPELLGLVQHVAAYERLAVQAAITGDRDLVYKALLAHPLIGQVPQVDELTDSLLTEGREHLPQFAPREVTA